MRGRLAAGFVLAAALGTGCGSSGDACDQYQQADVLLAGKSKGCGSGNGRSAGFSAATCKHNLGECSDADAQRISAYGGCVDQLPNCSTSTQSTWTFAEVNCGSDLAQVSPACLRDALGVP